jgi:hypothetical protein
MIIMDLALISLYGEGYHSGRTYSDQVWIKKESYDLIKGKLLYEICLGELDGKHSCVYGDVYCEEYSEKELQDASLELECDGDSLVEELDILYRGFDLDFDMEQDEIKQYIDELDSYVDIEVKVRKSQVDAVHDFIKGLGI